MLTELGDIQPWVVAVGGVTLLSGMLARQFAPKLPYMVVAMVMHCDKRIFLECKQIPYEPKGRPVSPGA